MAAELKLTGSGGYQAPNNKQIAHLSIV